MSLGDERVMERIAEVDFGQRPRAGWQDAVRKQIRAEEQPSHLTLVERSPEKPRRERWSLSFALSGLALAAAAAMVFFFVQNQRQKNQISERTRAIAMVVEFVELETEMAVALAKIDSAQARMDEAFQDLLEKKSSELL